MDAREATLSLRLEQYMRCFLLSLGILLVALATTFAQETGLQQCLGDGDFCSETAAVLIDSSCTQVFYAYRGRVSWPALRNQGPITVAVQTHRNDPFAAFPVYVEIVTSVDSLECQTNLPAISVILVAQGTSQCGGTWESIGPLDLTLHAIPIGALYRVQLEFFATAPDDHNIFRNSVGVSCIHVTSTAAIGVKRWVDVKRLYR
jgi:hypothetical protein